ncbi:sensor domain-containing diguanylate cyclase [Orrella daihaiensis]|uniref:Diguanylate cyclase n=1 Tax=Orrella daihaiensis TaxID=2782176 RepID=A0ABY4AJ08_9BURK|nr:diguanylate cyclase [Orrella daihaiensis]UOD50279.1 diguanylate cyclase [Orrella daihaiensis]
MDTNTSMRLKPQQVRRLGVAVGLALLILVWSSYFFAYQSVQNSFTKSTESALASETTLLEDHLERSLNLVTTILLTMGEMTNITMVTPDVLTPEELQRAIGNSHVIRSLSLIDSAGLVLTSSNPGNIGKTISPDSFSDDSHDITWRIGKVRFGEVLPYRDISDWSQERTSPTQQLMPAFYSVDQDGKQLIWVATINISFFENVWSRIDHNPAVEIAIFNYTGKKVMNHHAQPVSTAEVFKQLSSAISYQDIGSFYLAQDDNFLVVYRSDSQSPMIVTSIANMDTLSADTVQTREFLLLIATLGSLLIVGVLSALYRLYIRQARAAVMSDNLLAGITTHLLMTRSDLRGRIEDVNEPMLAATGYSRAELLGKDHKILNSGLEKPELFEHMWKTLAAGEIWRGTFRNKTKSGELLWLTATIIPFRNEWGDTTHYISLYSDITQAIRLSQEYEREKAARLTLESLNQKLRSEATLDPLTQVANRRGLDEFVREMNEQKDLARMSLAVLMIDIDHFKQINDTWGHGVGDVVLQTLAEKWSGAIRSSDLLVRLGGEEFALILPRTPRISAERIAEKLCAQTASQLIEIADSDQPLRVTISIGVAYAAHVADQTIDALLSQADDALYAAKSGGRNKVVTLSVD